MSRRPGLVALQCTRCSTPVPAEPDEVAWICLNCGQGLLLDEVEGGLRAIAVRASVVKRPSCACALGARPRISANNP